MMLKRLTALLCVLSITISTAAPVFAQDAVSPDSASQTQSAEQVEETPAPDEALETESMPESEPSSSPSIEEELPQEENAQEQEPVQPDSAPVESASQPETEQTPPVQEDVQAQSVTPWQQIEGRWYRFDEASGKQLVGFQEKTEGEDQGWYYYLEDGSLYPEGWHEVNGSLRYVEANGKFSTGWKEAPDGRHYLGDSGYSYKGWQKIDGRWYHLDETTGAQKLSWQYRTENGVRYTFYYFEDGSLLNAGWGKVNGYTRYVEADGSMHMGWLQDGGYTYYTSNSGIPLTGRQTIDGKTYVFDSEGRQQQVSAWQKIDGRWYRFDENSGQPLVGFQEKTEGEDQGWYYYLEDGSLYPEGWHEVNGSLRYVEASGKFSTGWKEAPDGRHYLGDSGYSYKGWQKIDGRWYHLDETTGAQKLSWQYRTENGVRYTFYYFEDGSLLNAGWGKVNGYTRYVEADGSMHMGWLQDGGYTYYTSNSGIPLTGRQTIDGKTYVFDSEGRQQQVSAWQKIDGRWYRFDENSGQPLVGFQEKTEGEDQGWYYYLEDGSLYPEGWHEVNGSLRYVEASGKFSTGWKEAPDGRHYLGDSGYSYKGWQKIDGRWYHLDETTGAQKLSWQYRTENGVRYTFYYFENGSLLNAGWGELNGYTRYVEADGSMHMGWLEDGGYTYYTSNSGIPLTGIQTIDGKTYVFDSQGRQQQVSTWEKIDGRWYHFDETSGKQLIGFQEKTAGEDQGWYYYQEDGSLYPEGWHEVNGSLRYVEASGKFSTGWKEAPDGRHYLGASGFSYKGWQKIDGRWYHLDETTGAQKLGWQYRTENGVQYTFYYFEDGSLMNAGWGKLNGYTRYVEADGSMHMGWLQDGGYTYYTSNSGIPLTGLQIIDGKGYVFDQECHLTKITDGWKTIDGKRYYAEGGGYVTGWKLLNGRWYVFSVTDCTQQLGFQEKASGSNQGWYYYKEDGRLYPEGWHEINGSLRYVEANGKFATGWKEAPDGRHYLGDSGYSYKGWQTIDSVWYFFSDSGVQQTGWRTRKVNNISYKHYFTPDGNAMIGWYKEGDNKYYFLSDGTGATGWQIIEGNKYYFDLQTGIAYRNREAVIDGVTYKFDQNGVATKVDDFAGGVLAIDVSYHQGTIDWKKVAESGVEYAIIRSIGWNKAAGTVGGVDSMFDYNFREAKKYGIKVGTYIYTYASTTEKVIAEIEAFDAVMKKLAADGYTLDLPVFIDQEDDDLLALSYNQRTELLRLGMVLLDQKGYYPGMYMYSAWAKNNVNTEQLLAEGYDLWIADVRTSVQNPDWNGRCVMWQYSWEGSIPGIAGNVDMNKLYKDYNGIIHGSNNAGQEAVAKFKVYDQNSGRVVQDTMPRLLAAIVSNEVGGGLKLTGADRMKLYQAQAIAAHSWLLYSYGEGNEQPSVGLNYGGNFSLILSQIESVQDMILTYGGKPALTVYGSCGNGKTNASGDYWSTKLPYLVAGIESKYDKEWSTFNGQNYFPTISRPRTSAEVSAELKQKHNIDTSGYSDPSKWFVINKRNEGGYIVTLTICGKTIKGGTLNDNFSPILSADFTVEYNKATDIFTFKSNGNGHGIGMSQFGAAGYIAKEGWSYQQVLAHYYPGTTLTTVD